MKALYTFLLFLCSTASATNYYFANIASGGNDANVGTNPGAPWCCAGKFAAIAATASNGDSILLKRGDVFDNFTVLDGQSNANFGAYGTGALPIVSGFTNLTSWTNVGTNLWEATCNSGLNLDLVRVNGVTVPAGRTPNAGTYWNIDSYTNLSGQNGTVTSSSLTGSWVGAEAVIRVNEYNLDRDKIIGQSGTTITYTSPLNINSIDGSNHKFFIQKHINTVDAQNEWYYNSATSTLRMYSTVNPGTLNVQAATNDFFIRLSYRNNVSITNLKITGYDSCGILGYQGNSWKIMYNTIEDIGVDGINFDTDSAFQIRYNTINRMGNSGIDTRYTRHTTIVGNIIDSCGLIRGMNLPGNQRADGICVEVTSAAHHGYAGDSVTITDNYVTNVGYCGVRFTGWRALIQRNYVNGFGYIHSDGGGVYTNGENGNFPYRLVSDNVIVNGFGDHAMYSSPYFGGMPGFYADDDTGNLLLKDNFIANCTRAGILMHNTIDIDIVGNTVFAGNGEFAYATSDDVLWLQIRRMRVNYNTFYSLPNKPIIELSSYNPDYAEQGTYEGNKYIRSSATTPFQLFGPSGGNFSLAQWKSNYAGDAGATITVVPDDSIRVEYNETPGEKYILLNNTFSDLKGSGYYRYVKVPSHGSLLLYRKTFGTIKTARPVKFAP